MMEEGSREIVGISGFVAVLAALQILMEDADEIRVADQSSCDAVER